MRMSDQSRLSLVLVLLLMVSARSIATSGNTISVSSQPVTALPMEMNGAGCGIEYIEHQIYGGLYTQMIVGESFEEPFNSSTGITVQWSIRGPSVVNVTHKLMAAAAHQRLNGLQYLRMATTGEDHAVWAQNRGLNMQGMSFSAGGLLEGWIWVRSAGAQVSLELWCSDRNHTLAAQSLYANSSNAWHMHNISLTPSSDCYGDGSFAIVLESPQAQLDIDMVFLQPGDWGRYKGLPVRKDLADFLLASGIKGTRMGGGTVNARSQLPSDSPPGSGYLLSNFRGPRWLRQPIVGLEYPVSSAGWGWVDFLDFCDAADITAAVTVNERDDPVQMIEYLFGSSATLGGKMRVGDGRVHPYNTSRILLEIGNDTSGNRQREK